MTSEHTYTPARFAADPECARHWARVVFLRGCGILDAFIGELGGWEYLPPRMEIGGEAWEKAEDEISEAAYAGRWWDVVSLGDAYLARIEASCENWRRIAANKAKGAAK